MKVGFASIDITPTLGQVIPGLFGPRIATGVLDPLQTTACVIREDNQQVVIIGADAVSFSRATADNIRSGIATALQMPASNIIIAASHTHCGGPANDVLGSEADMAYLDFCAERMITAATVAAHQGQPALSAQIAGRHAGWSFNRRFIMRDGSEKTQPGKNNQDKMEPAGPTDPELGLIAFRKTDGTPLGAIAGFACHPTCIFGTEFSGDFPSYWRSALRKALHPEFTMVFLNGACGDIAQTDFTNPGTNEHGVEWARKMGTALADRTTELMDSAHYETGPGIKTAHGSTHVAYRQPEQPALEAARELVASDAPWQREKWLARDLILLAERLGGRTGTDCPVTAFRIGRALLAAAPWQPFCEFGLRIKKDFPDRPVLIAAFANGMLGYVPTPQAFAGGGYEPTLCRGSCLAVDAGEKITAEIRRGLQSLA
ncbi:MAG: hypothetical protein ABR497_05405 [Kiritimatiellia bacterium]